MRYRGIHMDALQCVTQTYTCMQQQASMPNHDKHVGSIVEEGGASFARHGGLFWDFKPHKPHL